MSALAPAPHNPLFAPGETPSLAQICAVQSVMETLPQLDLRAEHTFSKGVCAKSLFMPADSFVIGKRHVTEHLLIIASGDVTITTSEGVHRLQGPLVLNTKPGIKRAILAHADTTLITIHVTDLTDPDAIVDAITEPDPIEGALA